MDNEKITNYTLQGFFITFFIEILVYISLKQCTHIAYANIFLINCSLLHVWIEKTGQAIITRHEIVIRWMMGKVLLAHPLFVVFFMLFE